ncbi:MAG: 4-hydroxythreonine-4-phosphate dehydrogenase PdxA [Succinivibrionaceae bacterium]|nr:4-hydroxythreonine-4-phosphate dehydrogenase PdxA [Succinivibrionaceae bacterium]
MSENILRIVISSGESAGIGPEICLAIAERSWPCQLVVLADIAILKKYARLLNRNIAFKEYDPDAPAEPSAAGTITWRQIPLLTSFAPGKLRVENSPYVINMLTEAARGCMSGEYHAVVTGPVHKGIIADSGLHFTGHTEFFRDYAKVKEVVMMLATKGLRVTLATTHIPLCELSKTITASLLRRIITIIDHDLKAQFGIEKPRIYVCGLNPHAGEGGHLGMEEINTIIPVLKDMKKKGVNVIGPMAADTVFQPKYMKDADTILTMYHDQGLPVLKYIGFGKAVNVTLGLPFIRTSVDHGTALDLAGKGVADHGSLFTAINYAIDMAKAKNGQKQP